METQTPNTTQEAPSSKARLVFSFIVLIVGFIVLYAVGPFSYQVETGWVIVGVGALSVIYNVICMKKESKA